MEKGFIHVYTGGGKGKTTACIGLAIRALGAGFNVFFAQFMKSGIYSEIKALKEISEKVYPGFLRIEQFGAPRKVLSSTTAEDIKAASAGFSIVEDALSSGNFGLIILDEINVAIHKDTVETERVLSLLEAGHPHTELVLSGRYALPEIIEIADLVTDFRCVKHYINNGVKARRGIEM